MIRYGLSYLICLNRKSGNIHGNPHPLRTGCGAIVRNIEPQLSARLCLLYRKFVKKTVNTNHFTTYAPKSSRGRVTVRNTIVLHGQIVFGSPKHNCNGVGICHILTNNLPAPCQCTGIPALISLSSEKKPVLIFRRDQLPPSCEAMYFSSDLFDITDAYRLSPALSALLGLTSYTIVPGKYRIRRLWSCLIVVF